jgi:hypothetical protein
MRRLEAELDQLRRLVYRAPGALLRRTHEQWEACIVDLASGARVAYESANSSIYRRIFNEVQVLCETAVEEEFSTLQLDDPAHLARRRASVSRSAVRPRARFIVGDARRRRHDARRAAICLAARHVDRRGDALSAVEEERAWRR